MVDPYWARVCGPLEPFIDGLRGELERLGYMPLSAARAVGRAPEPLDDRWWSGDIGVDAGNGGRVLRQALRVGYYNSLTARLRSPYSRGSRPRLLASEAVHDRVSRGKVVIVVAADHRVTAEGVSAYPSEMTGKMARNFASGGPATNVQAGRVGCISSTPAERVVSQDAPPGMATNG